MERYFKNKEDIYKFTYGSGKKVLVKCPDCGKEKYIIVKDLYKRQNIGCVCSDSVSYPEKFVIALLDQLQIDYIYQYSPKWVKPYRFDFFLFKQNIIIEVDGGIGHGNRYSFNELTLQELTKRDSEKETKAKEQGVEVIRINAFPSNFNTLKESVTISLKDILDLNKIDFNKCHEYGLTNLAKEACHKWNSGMSIIDISNNMKLSVPTIRKYLKNGSQMSMVNTKNILSTWEHILNM